MNNDRGKITESKWTIPNVYVDRGPLESYSIRDAELTARFWRNLTWVMLAERESRWWNRFAVIAFALLAVACCFVLK